MEPTPAAAPAPAPVAPAAAAPVAPAPQPPVAAPEPVLEAGGTVNKIDWVGWIFMGLGVAGITVCIWRQIQKAKESKKMADTVESLSAKVAELQGQIAASRAASNTGANMMMSFN